MVESLKKHVRAPWVEIVSCKWSELLDPQHVNSSGSSPVLNPLWMLSSLFLFPVFLHPVIKKSKELFCQRPSVGAGSTFLLSPEPAGLNLRSRTGPLTDSETCPRCWFCQSQPTRVGSVQWKPPRSSLTHKVNMTRWRTSSLTTDLNILLICLSQPGLRVKATVMAARGKPGGRKNAPEQIDPAVMINVTLHPAVTIRGCCVFEEWSLIRAVLVKPPVSRSCVLSDVRAAGRKVQKTGISTWWETSTRRLWEPMLD